MISMHRLSIWYALMAARTCSTVWMRMSATPKVVLRELEHTYSTVAGTMGLPGMSILLKDDARAFLRWNKAQRYLFAGMEAQGRNM